MTHECETMQPLMSGYLDGELNADDRAALEAHLARCASCREEFERMKQLVSAASELRAEPPPEEVWDTFLDGVYNRIERRTGWVVLVIGIVVLAGLGIYEFIVDPWGPALLKVIVALPVIGLGVLLVSVLRQRLLVAKTDRYSKEIMR